MPWKVMASMIGASVSTLVVVGAILWWFEGGGMAWMVAHGIGFLAVPGAVILFFLIAYFWWRMFLVFLFLLRANLDDGE